MRLDLHPEDAQIQAQVIRAAAAIERERSAQLRADIKDAWWFHKRLVVIYRAETARMRQGVRSMIARTTTSPAARPNESPGTDSEPREGVVSHFAG